MTKAELIAELTVLDVDGTNLKSVLEGWDDVNLPDFKAVVGDCEIVHEEGDCEGGGDHSEVVVHFKDHDIYLRATGFYSSYDGTDWDSDLTQVFPREKMITVYESETQQGRG